MRRTVDTLWDTASSVFGVVIGGIILGVLFQGWRMLPYWVGAVSPSVVIETAKPVMRDANQACFVLGLHKVALGQPIRPLYHVTTSGGGYSPELGVSVHRADEHLNRINDPLTEHQVGERWRSFYCFEMPGTVADADGLDVTGSLKHERRWLGGLLHLPVQEPIPPFTIAALR